MKERRRLAAHSFMNGEFGVSEGAFQPQGIDTGGDERRGFQRSGGPVESLRRVNTRGTKPVSILCVQSGQFGRRGRLDFSVFLWPIRKIRILNNIARATAIR